MAGHVEWKPESRARKATRPACEHIGKRKLLTLQENERSLITDRNSARDVAATDIMELVDTKQVELNELEFKQNYDADLLKAACAIANSGGGFIVIGTVEDDHHCATSVCSRGVLVARSASRHESDGASNFGSLCDR